MSHPSPVRVYQASGELESPSRDPVVKELLLTFRERVRGLLVQVVHWTQRPSKEPLLEAQLRGYSAEVRGMAAALTDASMDLHASLEAELLPTPTRAHKNYVATALSAAQRHATAAHP